MAVTTRFGYTIRAGTDTPDVIREVTDIQTRNEAIGALFSQGTIGARPAAAASNAGMFYRATDQGRVGIGVVYFSTGTAWVIPEPWTHVITDVDSPGFAPADRDQAMVTFTGPDGLAINWHLEYIASRSARKWAHIGGASSMRSFPGPISVFGGDIAHSVAPGALVLLNGEWEMEVSAKAQYDQLVGTAQMSVWAIVRGAVTIESGSKLIGAATQNTLGLASLHGKTQIIVTGGNANVDLYVGVSGASAARATFTDMSVLARPRFLGS